MRLLSGTLGPVEHWGAQGRLGFLDTVLRVFCH